MEAFIKRACDLRYEQDNSAIDMRSGFSNECIMVTDTKVKVILTELFFFSVIIHYDKITYDNEFIIKKFRNHGKWTKKELAFLHSKGFLILGDIANLKTSRMTLT
jgi:hypothetical protein